MFSIHRTAPERLSLTLSGCMDKASMSDGLDSLIAESKGFHHGRLLYRIHDLEWPSFEAVVLQIRRLPALFGLPRRFYRVGVVADQLWLRRAGELEGLLLPGIQWLDNATHRHGPL